MFVFSIIFVYLPLIYSLPLYKDKQNFLDEMSNFKLESIFNNILRQGCIKECILQFPETTSKSFKEIFTFNTNSQGMCKQIKNIEICLKNKKNCNNDLISKTFIMSSKLACNNENEKKKMSTKNNIKCLQEDSETLLIKCSDKCDIKKSVSKITRLDEDVKMIHFVNDDDKKVLALPDVSEVCQSSTCFLTCVGENMNKKCNQEKFNPIINLFNGLFQLRSGFGSGGEVIDVKSYFDYLIQTQCGHLIIPNDTVKVNDIKLPSSVGRVPSIPLKLPLTSDCKDCDKNSFGFIKSKNTTEVLTSIISEISSSLNMLLNR
uniref:CPG4 domain-containing protein n=1 Tax=Parastrongyloides trichosuri TaxID=131310 RepID=A0A0N4ZQA0_PARTI